MLRRARRPEPSATNTPWGHSSTVCRRFDSCRGRCTCSDLEDRNPATPPLESHSVHLRAGVPPGGPELGPAPVADSVIGERPSTLCNACQRARRDRGPDGAHRRRDRSCAWRSRRVSARRLLHLSVLAHRRGGRNLGGCAHTTIRKRRRNHDDSHRHCWARHAPVRSRPTAPTRTSNCDCRSSRADDVRCCPMVHTSIGERHSRAYVFVLGSRPTPRPLPPKP